MSGKIRLTFILCVSFLTRCGVLSNLLFLRGHGWKTQILAHRVLFKLD